MPEGNMLYWLFRDYATDEWFVLIAESKRAAIHIAHSLFKEPQLENELSYYSAIGIGYDIYAPEGYENSNVCKEARKDGGIVKIYKEA